MILLIDWLIVKNSFAQLIQSYGHHRRVIVNPGKGLCAAPGLAFTEYHY